MKMNPFLQNLLQTSHNAIEEMKDNPMKLAIEYFNEMEKFTVMRGDVKAIHIHEFSLPHGYNGTCVKRCHESDDGELWVSDDFRGTQVNFCPACGYEAKKKATYQ